MKLFLLGITFFSLFCYSCTDDRLDPIPEEEASAIPFSIKDARNFFESNATDLAPLSFSEAPLSKGTARANVELHPEWNKAMISGHKNVTLIEIPLHSTSVVLVQENIFKNKQLTDKQTGISAIRFIVAKQADGETDMIVVTIVPEIHSTERNLSKMLKEFRYLGGGSFSGKVFCSTLEGKFVKALGYTDGKLNGTLNTRIRKASNKMPTEDEEYSRLIFNEISTIKTKMFSGNESGGGIDYGKCPHGYTKGFCPYGCSAEIGDVEIVVCRYCGTQNGCICPKCFYCGQKEAACSCQRCLRCQKKVTECTCYLYPDPDIPVTPPSIGGGGGGGGGTTPGTSPVPQPDPLTEYIGKDNYYLKRIEDFKKRYPNAEVPDYYKNYGDFYLHEFKYKTYYLLSPQGQEWCLNTLKELQEAMSILLHNNPDLELNNTKFLEEAFATHVEAYCKAGIMWLNMTDKVFIFTTVYPSDLFSENGLKQVAKVSAKQIEAYRKNPAFAWEQAIELSRNWQAYEAIMLEYLLEKDKSDPRKASPQSKSRAAMEANDLMQLYFGESVEYFKATFGDQVNFPI